MKAGLVLGAGRRVAVVERARRTTTLGLRELRGTDPVFRPHRRARPARRRGPRPDAA
jgi:hypothetical protein